MWYEIKYMKSQNNVVLTQIWAPDFPYKNRFSIDITTV